MSDLEKLVTAVGALWGTVLLGGVPLYLLWERWKHKAIRSRRLRRGLKCFTTWSWRGPFTRCRG